MRNNDVRNEKRLSRKYEVIKGTNTHSGKATLLKVFQPPFRKGSTLLKMKESGHVKCAFILIFKFNRLNVKWT